MGQRLVITIKQNGEDIAALYYHWSAYSISALKEAKAVINVLYDDENEEKDLRLRLIRFCEKNGGGIDGGTTSDEWEYVASLYPNETFKSNNISRNCGLIALSEKGISDIKGWSEGDIYIDLDEDNVTNYVNLSYEDIDSYNEDRSEWDEEFKGLELKDVPLILGNLSDFSVSDIDFLIKQLESLDGYVLRDSECIYELIA